MVNETPEREQERTYVSQVDHDIEEKFRLLIIVTHFLNGLFDDQVLGDFRPHDILLLRHKPSPTIPGIDVSGGLLHQMLIPCYPRVRPHDTILLGGKPASSDTIVPLPCNFLTRAANALHLHT